jgi:hypothetical protein
MRESERPFIKRRALSFLFFVPSLYHGHTITVPLFDLHGSNQVTYRIWTHYKVVPYDISYIVPNIQPDFTGEFFHILLVPFVLYST